MEYLLGIPTLHIRGIFSICAKKYILQNLEYPFPQ